MRRLVFITDIVTPYTVAVMSELAEFVKLTVIFSDETSARGCQWAFDDLPFSHVVIGGLAVKRADPDVSDYYIDPRIISQLRRLRPDVIISAGWSVPTWYAALYCLVSGSSLVIQSDGTPLTERRLNGLQRVSREVLVPIATGFAANSSQAAQRFVDLGAEPDAVYAAPHSTNLKPYLEVGRRRLQDEHTPADQTDCGRLHALTIGRLVTRKGFEDAIHALAVARGMDSAIQLSIVGSGPDEERLRQLTRDLEVPVEFLGFIDQPQLAAVCARANAFVFPSIEDEFGFVLLEALAAGLACIASPFAGATHDLVVDGESGLVVDPRDHQRLGEALAALARDPALRRRLGECAHRVARERTPRHTAEGYANAAEATRRRRSSRGRRGWTVGRRVTPRH